MKLKKRHCATTRRLNFFGCRIVKVWNSLPQDIVMAPSVNCLKGRLDRHWKDIVFSTDIDQFYKI